MDNEMKMRLRELTENLWKRCKALVSPLETSVGQIQTDLSGKKNTQSPVTDPHGKRHGGGVHFGYHPVDGRALETSFEIIVSQASN